MYCSRTFLCVIAAAALTSASPQAASGLANLPGCVTTGALAAITASGCAYTDNACICSSASFIAQFNAYAEQNCDAADLQTVLAAGASFCAAAGVQVPNAVSSSVAVATTAATDPITVAAATSPAISASSTTEPNDTDITATTASASVIETGANNNAISSSLVSAGPLSTITFNTVTTGLATTEATNRTVIHASSTVTCKTSASFTTASFSHVSTYNAGASREVASKGMVGLLMFLALL